MSESAKCSVAAVVLCGGQSKRMGYPKANLPFGGQSMLCRTIERIRSAGVDTIILATAEEQPLPEDTPEGLRIVRDATPDRGPMEAIRGALRAAEPLAEIVFVAGCDTPLLAPELVRHMLAKIDGFDIVAAEDDRFVQPLNAVYRTRLAADVEALIDAGVMRPLALIQQSQSLRIPFAELTDFDPSHQSFLNMNRPEDYFRALEIAGLTPSPEIIKALNSND